jgi:hypothetical protein
MSMNVETVLAGCYGSSCPTTSSYLSVSSSRMYTVTASVTFSLAATVYASGGAGCFGGSLSDYAEVNITPYLAIWNATSASPYTLPAAYQTLFHLDSRDHYCGSGGAISLTEALTGTLPVTAYVYLQSGDQYQPSAGLQVTAFVVSTSAYYADVHAYTSGSSGSAVAVINSIGVT